MKIPQDTSIAPSEITPETLYNRRQFLKQSSIALTSLALVPQTSFADEDNNRLQFSKSSQSSLDKDPLTSYESITTYNNFYELGTSKSDPHRNARWLKTNPWSLVIEGEVNKPTKLNLEDIHQFALEERIYRMRCVEAWSMVIPWVGFQLSHLLERCEPTSKAQYVEFTTIYSPENLLGQRLSILKWPYKEGLRIDEAMHPLTLIATGLYGKHLLPQNGSPLRLVVPWKYGFKSIKSIVRIRLTENQPDTSWNIANPREYGFYSNVNPQVHHPRWRQNRERRIGEIGRRKTLLFNGYHEVAELYKEMDLRKLF